MGALSRSAGAQAGRTRRVPGQPEREARRRRGPGFQAPGSPDSPPGVAEEAAPPGRPRARADTCCVLKSQPRQQRRAACSAMAAEVPGGVSLCRSFPRPDYRRASTLGYAGVRPSPRPAGLRDPRPPRPCALAPPAGEQGGDAPRLGLRLRFAAGRPTGVPCAALSLQSRPAPLPIQMCSLHRPGPNAACLLSEDAWARGFNLKPACPCLSGGPEPGDLHGRPSRVLEQLSIMVVSYGAQGNVPWGWRHGAPAGPVLTQ